MPDPAHDFGAHLRQAREHAGVSVREIALRTKISVQALEALERSDISRLPGGIFTRSFVRAYAREVGLDPDDTITRFLARFPDEAVEEIPRTYEANPNHIDVDEPPTRARAWRAVAWSIPLLLVVAYFGAGGRMPSWPARTGVQVPAPKTNQPPTATTPAPAPLAQPSSPAGGEAGQGAQATPPAGTPSAPPGEAKAMADATTASAMSPPTGSAGASAAPPPVPAAGAPTSPAAAPGARPVSVPATENAVSASAGDAGAPGAGAFRVTLAPRTECWVSVRANGTTVFAGLMKGGERKDLALSGDVTLRVGDAGAFAFLINDQPGRPLGEAGQPVTARLSVTTLSTFLAR